MLVAARNSQDFALLFDARPRLHARITSALAVRLPKLHFRRYCWVRVERGREAVLVDRVLPGEKFIDRERVAAAGFLQRE